MPTKREAITALAGLIFGASGVAALPQDTRTPIEQAAALQEEYFAKTGKYLQVLPDNKLPHYEEGTLLGKLGANLPPGTSVNVYEGPQGKGYQIVYEDSVATYGIGSGPQAEEFTFITPKLAPPAATSTP